MQFVRSASLAMALVLCAAAPAVTERPEVTLTMTAIDRGAIAASHQLAVIVTIKNVSGRVIYVDPLDVSLFVSFRIVCIATGEENEALGGITLDEFEPPHTGTPMPPQTSLSILKQVAPVGAAGVFRITVRGSLLLPSSRSIRLRDSNPVDITVLAGAATEHAVDSCVKK